MLVVVFMFVLLLGMTGGHGKEEANSRVAHAYDNVASHCTIVSR